MPPNQRPNLAITYANDQLQDGAGSQLLRIYGIYALSRFLGVPYFHSPIEHIGYHGLQALTNNAPFPHLLGEYNQLFHIPSDVNLPDTYLIDNMIHPDMDRIAAIRDSENAGDFTLIRILFPFSITDNQPEIYRFATAISPFPRNRSKVFRLAIHVRRGELYVLDGHKMLSNSYYLACARIIQDVLNQLGVAFVCELYTEVPSKTFVVTPDHHGIEGRISENVTLDPSMNRLEDFDVLQNLEKFINTDPIDTLRRMATADALILSRSAFSFIAAVLNQDCIAVCFPLWPKAMKGWLLWDDNGRLPVIELVKRVLAWKQAST